MIIEISPRAQRQIRTARRWWLQNRDKAPEAFVKIWIVLRNCCG
ncbi:MAG TPA: hypothetical protein VG323_07445 [Thermoanaerobaculia bacterium]|nr:hypothetical protein [Thermoanaerobaculia bacterium]